MSRRRSVPDPLAPIPYPTWLVVGDMLRNPLEVTKLEPHADARAILNAARAAKTAEGRTCDEIGRCCSFFFAVQAGKRIEVGILRHDPAVPFAGHR
jgi:hypothetical protein